MCGIMTCVYVYLRVERAVYRYCFSHLPMIICPLAGQIASHLPLQMFQDALASTCCLLVSPPLPLSFEDWIPRSPLRTSHRVPYMLHNDAASLRLGHDVRVQGAWDDDPLDRDGG